MPHKPNEVVAIGSTEWCDRLEAESPEGTVVIRTLAGVAARRFTPDQLRIDPDVESLDDFDKVRTWVSQVIRVRFGPGDGEKADEILAPYNLLTR